MYRKGSSSFGLVLFDDRKLYISDCGDDFLPSGPDHLDFYYSKGDFDTALGSSEFEVGEDGVSPAPTLKFVNKASAKSLTSALRSRDSRLIGSDNSDECILH
jgi:hypothetical protein